MSKVAYRLDVEGPDEGSFALHAQNEGAALHEVEYVLETLLSQDEPVDGWQLYEVGRHDERLVAEDG